MKTRIFLSVLGMILLSLIPCRSPAHPSLLPDSTQTENPLYKNVNVVVEYSWDGIERSEKVDVQVNLTAKKPHVLIIKENQKQCEVLLFKGVAVKIYDLKTGKLIKTVRIEK